MTIDEIIRKKSFEMGLPYRVIAVDDIQDIIHEALKKQREICVEEFSKWISNEKDITNWYESIINAPEPEL